MPVDKYFELFQPSTLEWVLQRGWGSSFNDAMERDYSGCIDVRQVPVSGFLS